MWFETTVNMAGQGSQVKKSCSCCKMYMDHLCGKMASFLMLMSANYRHSMRMPARFMNQFGGEISESIDIESPDGSVYTVKGTKYMNKMLPQYGWKAFVDAHPIEENDSLLFQHIEKAHFKVLIIDSDGCEKVFSCDGIRISSSNIQERDTDCVDASDRSHDRANKSSRVRKRVSSYQRDCPSQRRKAARITTTKASSSEESGFDDDSKTNGVPDYVLSCTSMLSEEQEKEVDGLLKQIQPETTVFVAVLKPGNVKPQRPQLVIPRAFGAEHFPHKNQVVTLQRLAKSKKWYPTLNFRKDRNYHVLMGRWSDFVQDNHLQERDICIFQPLKTARETFTLMVHLIRQSKVGTSLHGEKNGNSPSPAGGTSSSRGRTMRSKASDVKIVHSNDGKAKAKVTTIERVKEEPADQGPSNSKDHVDDESGDSSGPSEAGLYILSAHAHLADEQRKKVEDVVGSIQSQVPIYVAVMSKSSVTATGMCTLYFGKQYTSKYLPHGEHTVTLVRSGKSTAWKVKMNAHKLIHGWRGFVQDNRLKLNDICLFQLIKDDIKMLTMTVYIIRHV